MRTFPRWRTLRGTLAAALIAALGLSLAAPGLHARPTDPMGCAAHHALTAGTVLAPLAQGICAATPDACRLMLGCGAVAPVPATVAVVVNLAQPVHVYHRAPAPRLAGVAGRGPPTPPPNS